MGLTCFHVIFLDIPHSQFECGDYLGILRKIMSVPYNTIMDLNNIMHIQDYTLMIFVSCSILTESIKRGVYVTIAFLKIFPLSYHPKRPLAIRSWHVMQLVWWHVTHHLPKYVFNALSLESTIESRHILDLRHF